MPRYRAAEPLLLAPCPQLHHRRRTVVFINGCRTLMGGRARRRERRPQATSAAACRMQPTQAATCRGC